MTASFFVPVDMNDAVLTASNIPEDDYPAWVSGETVAIGDRRIRTTTHKVYEAAFSGVANDAPENNASQWITVGSTNRWRPFDGSLGQDATNSGSITYTFAAPIRLDAIAFVGLGAVSARVVVKNSDGDVVYDETRDLVDASLIGSWLEYFTYETEYDPEQVFTGLPVFALSTVEVTLDGEGGAASVGEIVFGREVVLGKILSGSRSGFTDYTVRNVDDFGNIDLVTRATARKAEWRFIYDTRSNRRIQRELENARGKKCFFYPGENMTDFYLSVFGVADEFYPALDAGGNTIDTLSLTGVS